MNTEYIDKLLDDAKAAADRGDVRTAEAYRAHALELIRAGK